MTRRASHPAAAVLLAFFALSACDTGPDLDDYETRATAEFREAQRRDEEGPPKMTRQQALAEYRKCTRKFAGRQTNPCGRWMDLAYPPSSHMLNTPPRPPGGNNAPITDELLDAMHPSVETLKP
jgi:hypothetical protein